MSKILPLYQTHEKAGAKFVDFGGFQMPVQYEGIIAEHKAVRTGVGVFDVSHMGEIDIIGNDACKFLEKITTNSVVSIPKGKAQYTVMLYDNGTIVDDLIIYCIEPQKKYFAIVNASNIEKDFAWMKKHCSGDVALINRSEEMGLLAIQGPFSEKLMQELTSFPLESIPYYGFAHSKVAGMDMLIARTGYTGEKGFEICFDISLSEKIWNTIFEVGAKYSVKPIGLGARDTLRLEMGYSLYGHEITDQTNPLEAGLGWVVKLEKEFIGKSALVEWKKNPIRKLVGFVLEEKAIARQGYKITDGSNPIGEVCSGTISPMMNKAIGTGYITLAHIESKKPIFIAIRDKHIPAQITKPPFWKKSV